jgi:hypothetical protein
MGKNEDDTLQKWKNEDIYGTVLMIWVSSVQGRMPLA